MTEAEWNAGTFSTPLFEFLRSERLGTQRQRFLLALACCHAVRPKMSPAGRQAVAVAERFVSGEAKEAERAEAMAQAGKAAEAGTEMAERSADWCAYRLVRLAAERGWPATWNDDTAAQIAQV